MHQSSLSQQNFPSHPVLQSQFCPVFHWNFGWNACMSNCPKPELQKTLCVQLKYFGRCKQNWSFNLATNSHKLHAWGLNTSSGFGAPEVDQTKGPQVLPSGTLSDQPSPGRPGPENPRWRILFLSKQFLLQKVDNRECEWRTKNKKRRNKDSRLATSWQTDENVRYELHRTAGQNQIVDARAALRKVLRRRMLIQITKNLFISYSMPNILFLLQNSFWYEWPEFSGEQFKRACNMERKWFCVSSAQIISQVWGMLLCCSNTIQSKIQAKIVGWSLPSASRFQKIVEHDCCAAQGRHLVGPSCRVYLQFLSAPKSVVVRKSAALQNMFSSVYAGELFPGDIGAGSSTPRNTEKVQHRILSFVVLHAWIHGRHGHFKTTNGFICEKTSSRQKRESSTEVCMTFVEKKPRKFPFVKGLWRPGHVRVQAYASWHSYLAFGLGHKLCRNSPRVEIRRCTCTSGVWLSCVLEYTRCASKVHGLDGMLAGSPVPDVGIRHSLGCIFRGVFTSLPEGHDVCQ